MAADPITHSFAFSFDPVFRVPARLLGINEGTAVVEVTDRTFEARFGRWVVRTPLDNIEDAQVTGPYSTRKVIGPPHLSFSDRGLTMATNPWSGACISFRRPVRGMDPLGLLRHPGLTVTVGDPEGLVEILTA